MLTEVTGQAVVQVLVELGAVGPLQPGAQAEVRQLHMTLETKEHKRYSHLVYWYSCSWQGPVNFCLVPFCSLSKLLSLFLD